MPDKKPLVDSVRKDTFREVPRVQKFFTKPSRTKQAHKGECNINEIVKRAKVSGAVSHLPKRTPQWGLDVSGVPSYHESIEMINQADRDFMTLPSDVRSFFDNDPGNLLEFMENPANRDKAIELGLVPKPDPRPADHPNRNEPPAPNAPAASKADVVSKPKE